MANLDTKIKLYLEANSKTENELLNDNVVLQDNSDGAGVFIASWNVSGLVQPTEEQLNALESQATTLENNNQVIATRKGLYGTLEQQIENIMENGLQSEIDRVNQIKTENPKS